MPETGQRALHFPKLVCSLSFPFCFNLKRYFEVNEKVSIKNSLGSYYEQGAKHLIRANPSTILNEEMCGCLCNMGHLILTYLQENYARRKFNFLHLLHRNTVYS